MFPPSGQDLIIDHDHNGNMLSFQYSMRRLGREGEEGRNEMDSEITIENIEESKRGEVTVDTMQGKEREGRLIISEYFQKPSSE